MLKKYKKLIIKNLCVKLKVKYLTFEVNNFKTCNIKVKRHFVQFKLINIYS